MNPFFVSVVIPVCNGEKIIGGCIESVLKQDYPKENFEIIVVDNNSSDKTTDIVKKYPVSYIEEKTIRSSYAARNKGIKQAKGDIIAFIDADCIASQDWIRKGVEGFRDVEIGCVAGEIKGRKAYNFVEDYLLRQEKLSQKAALNNFFLPYAQTANVFYRKTVFEKIGSFEKKWVSSGDADFGWRMQLETPYKIKFIPESLVFHRHRATVFSMFKQCTKWGIGYTLLYKKYRKKLQKRTFKEVLWVFLRLFYILVRIPVFCIYKKEKMPQKKRDGYLDMISFLGWEIGRIIGSIKNLVFCI